MAFLPCSKVMLSDGTFKRIDLLEIGESIKTYVTSSNMVTVDGIERPEVGYYSSSSIQSITTESIVRDYENLNLSAGEQMSGVFNLLMGNSGSEIEMNCPESKFSADTLIYSENGFASIYPATHGHLHENQLILDSLQETEFSSDNGWKRIESVRFYNVNDNETDGISGSAADLIILDDTPMYKLTTQDGNPFVVANFIVKN